MELCGLEQCSAPEILRGQEYSFETDMWSVGVILFILLSGRRPFEEDEKYDLYIKVASGDYSMESPEWSIVSPDGRDFVNRLLKVEPHERMTVAEALADPWLKFEADEYAYDATLKHLRLTTMGRRLRRVIGATKTAVSFRQFTRLTQRPE
jgi:serine/threonine protein kinase